MTDMEVTLGSDVKEVFASTPVATEAPIPIEPPTEGATDSPKNVISEWPPMGFPPPMNTTFFVNQGSSAVQDDEESIISSDTPSAIIFETEQKMRDSIKAIQFKEMLLKRDRHSREIIIRRCIEWLQMPTSRQNGRSLDWFTSLSALKTTESIENSYLWHTLYDTGIFASESFKNVISFFEEL